MKPSSVLAAAVGIGLAGSASLLPAQADHHQLKRALQDARCIPVKTTVTQHQGTMIIYDVDCLGRSPDRVFVVCNGRVCMSDDPSNHSSDDDLP
ncbi:hypothetical protein F1D61_32505 (plasmid) [Methylobacterium aquaticum]|nr:hypothetical protein F1D61_32505 [Methylobacterium aquaticum]